MVDEWQIGPLVRRIGHTGRVRRAGKVGSMSSVEGYERIGRIDSARIGRVGRGIRRHDRFFAVALDAESGRRLVAGNGGLNRKPWMRTVTVGGHMAALALDAGKVPRRGARRPWCDVSIGWNPWKHGIRNAGYLVIEVGRRLRSPVVEVVARGVASSTVVIAIRVLLAGQPLVEDRVELIDGRIVRAAIGHPPAENVVEVTHTAGLDSGCDRSVRGGGLRVGKGVRGVLAGGAPRSETVLSDGCERSNTANGKLTGVPVVGAARPIKRVADRGERTG